MDHRSDSSQRRFDDLISVIESTRALAEAADSSEAMSLFARELTLLFDASACLISEYDASTSTVTDWAAYVIPPAQLNVVAENYQLDEYPSTRRVLEGLEETSTCTGDGGDPAEHRFLEEAGFGASMMVPLVMDGAAAGLIELFDVRERVFDADDRRFCRLLADQAGIVLGAVRMADRLEEQHLATVGALAAALEAKDAYTNDHASQIAELAGAVCERLGIPAGEARIVRLGALLHDIGKIGIPEAILRKPGPLSAEEMARMQEHPDIGARILEPVPYFADLVPLVRSSHERWDGGGYPDGLGGPAIPLGSRVIAVCDAFHAMIEDRVYRKALSVEGAVAEIERCSGTQFDPTCATALVAVVREAGSGRVARGGVVRIAKRPS